MPQIFKIGSYWIYFWSNESDPLEPIHVHVAEGSPIPNATKIWITKKENAICATIILIYPIKCSIISCVLLRLEVVR